MTKIPRNDFIEWLKLKSLSQHSIKNYLFYFDHFDSHLFISQSTYPYEFLNQYKNNDVVRGFLSNLFDFIKRYPSIDSSFKEHIKLLDFQLPKKTGRKKVRIQEIPTREEIEAISKATNRERDALMILITFYGGLRDCELIGDDYGYIGITPYDFNWRYWLQHPSEIGKLKVRGKGDKERIVFTPQHVMSRLNQFIRSISTTQRKEDKLFKVKVKRWQDILSNASRKSVGRHINPHLLRKACSIWLRDECGMDLDDRREYLGHDSVVITDKHYNKVDRQQLEDKFNSRHS